MTIIETSRPAKDPPTTIVSAPGGTNDTQRATASVMPRVTPPAGTDSRPASHEPTPKPPAPGGTELTGRQLVADTQTVCAASDQPVDRHLPVDAQRRDAVGSNSAPDPAAKVVAIPNPLSLLDPALELAAAVLDDIERVKIANENRLRQLTRSVEDSDGEMRGFGLDESHPDVARLAAIVAALGDVEHQATLQLQRQVRRHPLGPWMAAQKGIGEKQGARLLAAIGDPYISPELTKPDGTVIPEGPRTVSALWAYCGYHVVPAGQQPVDTQRPGAGGDGGDPGHQRHSIQEDLAGVAPKRARGAKANWNATAKMRAYLIAEKVIQCGNPDYRAVYDARKAATEERVHVVACVRCGPSGKPAPAGSPWSKAHRHADALRVVAKAILRELWREAKRIHEAGGGGHRGSETHESRAAVPICAAEAA